MLIEFKFGILFVLQVCDIMIEVDLVWVEVYDDFIEMLCGLFWFSEVLGWCELLLLDCVSGQCIFLMQIVELVVYVVCFNVQYVVFVVVVDCGKGQELYVLLLVGGLVWVLVGVVNCYWCDVKVDWGCSQLFVMCLVWGQLLCLELCWFGQDGVIVLVVDVFDL